MLIRTIATVALGNGTRPARFVLGEVKNVEQYKSEIGKLHPCIEKCVTPADGVEMLEIRTATRNANVAELIEQGQHQAEQNALESSSAPIGGGAVESSGSEDLGDEEIADIAKLEIKIADVAGLESEAIVLGKSGIETMAQAFQFCNENNGSFESIPGIGQATDKKLKKSIADLLSEE